MIITGKQLYTPFQNNGKIPQNFSISDVDFFCPTYDMVKDELFPKYWKWLQALKLTKWVHKWDCDNFADSFKLFCCGYYEQVIESEANGIAVGVVYYVANSKAEDELSGAHAINIVYIQDEKNDDGSDNFKLLFVEPQNGKFYNLTPEEFNSIYTIYI